MGTDEALRVVIVGAGRVGFAAAQRLNDRDQTLVIVDKDPEVAEQLVENELGTVVCGNITSPEVLEEVSLHTADVVAGLTNRMEANLTACLLAAAMTDVRTVLRVNSSAAQEYYQHVADSIVYPEELGAKAAANAITGTEE